MKKLNVLVAAVALLASAAVASAADQAWFTLEGSSPGGVISATQGAGQALVITKGTADVTLTIGFNITSATGALNGWAIALSGNTTAGGAAVTGFTRVGTGYDTPSGGALANIGTGGTFDVGNGSFTSTGSTGLVVTFDLLITGKFPGSTTNILGAIGGAETFLSDGYVWNGTTGPNTTAVDGYAGNSFGNLPVITINNVPEPATMALLGLGVMCLIRRRR